MTGQCDWYGPWVAALRRDDMAHQRQMHYLRSVLETRKSRNAPVLAAELQQDMRIRRRVIEPEGPVPIAPPDIAACLRFTHHGLHSSALRRRFRQASSDVRRCAFAR